MFKKLLAVLMCFVLICGMSVVANAEGVSSDDNFAAVLSESSENQIQPRYSYTRSVSASLSNSGGDAVCSGEVDGYNSTTKIVFKMTLQKKTVLWWSDVYEWNMTVSSNYATLSRTVSVDSGKYRVKVEATVYSGSSSEDVSCTSTTCDF